VRKILAATKSDIKALIGNAEILRQCKPQSFVDGNFGLPTVTDILRELEKPGRDPRPAFKAAVFKEGVETLKDLKPGMVLEGRGNQRRGVRRLRRYRCASGWAGAHLGDVEVLHQGSARGGEVGRHRQGQVLEVEVARKRIALTLRLDDELGGRSERPAQGMPRDNSRASMTSSAQRKPQEQSGGGALAEALRRASEKGASGKNKA